MGHKENLAGQQRRISASPGSAFWLQSQSPLVHLDPFGFASVGGGDRFSMVLCDALWRATAPLTLILYPEGPTLSHGDFSWQGYLYCDLLVQQSVLLPGEAVKLALLCPFALWSLTHFSSLPK